MNKKRIILISAIVLFLVIAAVLICLYCQNLSEKRKMEELLAQLQAYYDSKIALYEKENTECEPYETDIAFVGDSLTDGYDIERYYPEYVVKNRGIGGDTTHGLLDRLDISLYDLKPKVIVMLIGANNLKTMFEDYEGIVKGITQNLPETHLVICSLTSMGREWGKNNHLAAYNNVKIKAIADQYNCSFVDLYTPLLNTETDEIFEHYTTDGGHLTDEGYVVLTEAIKPAVDKILKNK